MTNPPRLVPATQLTLPRISRQLCIAFEGVLLRGMTQTERAKIIAHLANILLQAASAARRERDDDDEQ